MSNAIEAAQESPDSLPLCYRMLFERNPMPMCVCEAGTLRVLAANQAAASHYGYSTSEFVGLTLLDLHDPRDHLPLQDQLRLPADEQGPRHQLWRHRHRSGAAMEVETVMQHIEVDGLRAHIVLMRDVTDQRLTARRLAEEHDTLAAVVNSTHDAVISVNVAGLVQTFNPGAELIFGRTASSMLGQSMEILMPERFRAAHRQHLAGFDRSEESTRMMGLGLVRGLRADGQELDLEGTIAKFTIQQQTRLLVNLRDVTERVRSDAEFEHSRTQLSDLTQRLMSQEKTLVKRLAQALHDQVGQTMAAIRMAHETMVAVQAGHVTPEVDRLQSQLSMLIGQAIRQVRQVLIDLRPPLLEEHGLASALDNELRNRSLVMPKVDFAINVTPEVTAMRWPSDVEYAAFMVAREAIENALRHSGSTSVSLSLSGGPLSLELEVLDEGAGIADGAVHRGGHLGILGMHERANAVGATVTIDSDPHHGTRVQFSWQPAS